MMMDGPGLAGLQEGLDQLVHVGTEGHRGDVDVAVAHAHEARFFLPVRLPAAANWATADIGVDLEIWPPVLEYTSVSSTSTLTFLPVATTWSRPP